MSGKIDASILATLTNSSVDKLVKFLKEKDFGSTRKWVAENEDIDSTILFNEIYNTLYTELEDDSIPQMVLYVADYQYKDAFVANKSINTLALLTEIMANLSFKGA